MYGRVMRYFRSKGYGSIFGDDGNTYFIHHSNLNGKNIEKGYYVYFKPFMNDRSDYNAMNVITIESNNKTRRRRINKIDERGNF